MNTPTQSALNMKVFLHDVIIRISVFLLCGALVQGLPQHKEIRTQAQQDDILSDQSLHKNTEDQSQLAVIQTNNQPITESNVTSPVHCLPIKHELLWLKLNTHPSIESWSHRFSLTGDDQHGEDQSAEDSSEEIRAIDNDIRPSHDNHTSSHNMKLSDIISSSASSLLNKKILKQSESNKFESSFNSVRRRKRSADQRNRRTNREKRLKSKNGKAVKGSWQCELDKEWKRMPDGVFPPFIETGRCRQKTCMLDTYACVPKRYVIMILRRVDKSCIPQSLATEQSSSSSSSNTTAVVANEEAWTFSEFPVTVGCDCSKRRRQGLFNVARTSANKNKQIESV